MERKEATVLFRCTREEAEKISRAADKEKISHSEYIRRKVFHGPEFRLPENVAEILDELKHYDLKIGTNINQVVRSCNSKKFITGEDYRALVKYLEKIDEKYYLAIEEIKKIYAAGNPQQK